MQHEIRRLQSLIEKLPQLIETQAETIIRQQLFAADPYFVAKEQYRPWLKSTGTGYETRINAILRDA